MIAIDILLLVVCLISFMGQLLSFIAPKLATTIGVNDDIKTVTKTHYIIEAKAEALTDIILLWILPVGILLKIVEVDVWKTFCLIGSGCYMYFSLLIIFTRIFLKRDGLKYGTDNVFKQTIVFGTIWFLSGLYYLIISI